MASQSPAFADVFLVNVVYGLLRDLHPGYLRQVARAELGNKAC